MTTVSKEASKEWGLSSLLDSEQTDSSFSIGRILYQALLVRSLDILSEKEEDELDALLDKDSTTPEDVLAYLQSKIPTFERLVTEERLRLKSDLFVMV